MKITISNTANEPLYQQIMEQIKENILSGELQEGELLPSIRSFANDLKVSVLTIRRVYEELEKEGFVVSQVGLGTFVKAGNTELFRESKRRMIEEKLTEALTLASMLDISKEEIMEMLDILSEEIGNG